MSEYEPSFAVYHDPHIVGRYRWIAFCYGKSLKGKAKTRKKAEKRGRRALECMMIERATETTNGL